VREFVLEKVQMERAGTALSPPEATTPTLTFKAVLRTETASSVTEVPEVPGLEIQIQTELQ
jgi:hypothetical protein